MMNVVRASLHAAIAGGALIAVGSVTGCSSSSSSGNTGGSDAGALDGSAAQDAASGDAAADANDAGAAVGGSGMLSGSYGGTAIAPVVAAYWIGKPSNPAESGGGPFLYLFSGPVTCDDLSHGSGWLGRIPAGVQVLEMIVGSTSTGTAVPAAAHAAAGAAEINYLIAPSSTESRATSGSVTLSAYNAGDSVDGTITATFPMGSATGTFHAVYCPNGNEL